MDNNIKNNHIEQDSIQDQNNMDLQEDLSFQSEEIDAQTDSMLEKKTNVFSGKTKIKKVDKKIELLEEENKALNDKYLRLYSEFDNYRKRTIKEKLEFIRTASESLIKELLPVLDDFDRAVNSITAEDERSKELLNGINLIQQKFFNILKKNGLSQIEVIAGNDFDLNFQEAIASMPVSSEEEKGKIIDVVEKGYKLGDTIIRFSKVVVGA